MKQFFSLLLLLLPLPLLTACQQQEETVETAYLLPLLPEPEYKFSRNGYSNVDILECGFLQRSVDYLYRGYLREARISLPDERQGALFYFNEGEYGLQPAQATAASPRFAAQQAHIRQDLLQLIDAAAQLSGYGQSEPYRHRNRPAQKGQSGFVGHDLGDDNKFFVDAQGLAPSEVFRYYAMGAIYLDKVLNEHLQPSLFADATLQREHQDVSLVRGRNYTALEHRLDLAYGYYQQWQPLTRAEGLPILKESHRKIFTALVQARTLLQYYRYEDIVEQIGIVRTELSKVVPIRAMNLLVGANTLANIEESPQNAFDFLSQAIGLIRCLPFTLRADGTPYFTYEEADALVADLLADQGLWSTERLLAPADKRGSLRNIATRVGQPFGIALQDLKR